MLNMLNRWGEMGPLGPKKFNIFNISPVLSIFPKKHLTFPLFCEGRGHETGGMLNVFFAKVLKTGEMLNMLNFLGPKATFRPTDLTYLTYLTFPLF